MSRRKRGMTAAEAAALPPEERPTWYRPADPYRPENAAALTSGARSPRVYGEVSRVLVAGLLEHRPDLAAHPEALASWGDAEARAALLRKHLDEVGMLDANGGPRESMLTFLDRCERRAAEARHRLGLDPRSEAELAILRARAIREGQIVPQVNLATLAEQGRAVLGSASDPVAEALHRVRAKAAEGRQSNESVPHEENPEELP